MSVAIRANRRFLPGVTIMINGLRRTASIGLVVMLNLVLLSSVGLAPPTLGQTASEQDVKQRLNAEVDRMVKKWKGDLEEAIQIAMDTGPADELANLDDWASHHLKRITGQVSIQTPAHQEAFRDYLKCLDKTVYASHLNTQTAIDEGKKMCLDQFKKVLSDLP